MFRNIISEYIIVVTFEITFEIIFKNTFKNTLEIIFEITFTVFFTVAVTATINVTVPVNQTNKNNYEKQIVWHFCFSDVFHTSEEEKNIM